MATLAEIRARLQAQDTKSSGFVGDKAIYPHWNIAEGTSAKVRFVPDGDATNDFFWVERAMIKLPFAGIKGQMDSKPVTVQVPCVEMWGETCPILAEVRPWFKDASLEDMGRKYWKKRSYIFQGFVHDSSYQEESVPENPIRRFIIGPQIFNVVKAVLMDPDVEEMPTSYDRGLDFTITKTTKGGFNDYSTSNWARRESALTAVELAAIDSFGLFSLKDFLPKKPTPVELDVMKEMFEASVDGQAYDPDKWSNYFKPPGLSKGEGRADIDEEVSARAARTVTRPTVAPKPTAKVVDEDAADDSVPFDVAPAEAQTEVSTKPSSNAKAEDILAMIRNRQK